MTSASAGRSVSLRALADAGLGIVGTATSKLAAFAAGVVLARAMSPTDYGQYLTWMTAALLATPVLDAGFTALVFRRASEGRFRGLALRATRQRLGYWSAAVVGGVIVALLAGPEAALVVALAGVIAASQAHLDTMVAELEGTGRFGPAARLRGILGFAFLLAALLASTLHTAALGALTALALSRVVVAAIASVGDPGPVFLGRLPWRDAAVLGTSAIVTLIYVQSDIVLLAWLGVPQSEVAVYAVGYTFLIGLQLLPGSVGGALFPRVVARGLSSPKFVRALGLVSLLTATTVTIMALNGPLLFQIFGSHYRREFEIGLPVIMLIVPVGLNMMLASSLVARRREHPLLLASLLGVVINVGLNLVLIPRFGTQGALSATAAAETALLLVLSRLARAEGAARALDFGVVGPTLLISVALLFSVSTGWRTLACALASCCFAVPLLKDRIASRWFDRGAAGIGS